MAYGKSRERNHQPSASEAEFNLGVLYSSIEQQINAYAEKAGPAYSVADAADRVGQLLRLKASHVRQERRATELLHEMREELPPAGEGAGDRAGFEARSSLHVRARSDETLNTNGRRKDYGRPQNPERVEKIRKMLHAGMSYDEIGKTFGITGSAIHHQAVKYDLHPNGKVLRKRGEPVDAGRIEQVRKMLASGMTRRDVAEAIGITKDGVGYYIRTYNMEEPSADVRTKPSPYSKKNPHWTQLPKNRARVAKWARKMRRMRGVK